MLKNGVAHKLSSNAGDVPIYGLKVKGGTELQGLVGIMHSYHFIFNEISVHKLLDKYNYEWMN